MQILINTDELVEINGFVFPRGEWKHLPEDFGKEYETDDKGNKILVKDALAEYSLIKPAYVVLQDMIVESKEDLTQFAVALKESNEIYKQEVPEVATKVLAKEIDVLKYEKPVGVK